ncbi:beta-xylanase [Parastagonospora nodorum]|nr:beta-xylanase [Parastagonospora nodorum]KAH4339647.1 beta-xylanase [Parastagonospora nodorum]KAH4357039.1 beta-xylanase [Parastagonospora nodorum]KAH4383122.1 beta-xylanase [Parastagonospora nodorum]KAH4901789.1 beta-xylanase [Parastagonospora nodorum]
MHFSGQSVYLGVTFLSSSTAVLAAVQPWGQCGGMNFKGDTACAPGWTCNKFNDWYSQCIGGNMNQPGPVAPPPAVPQPSNDSAPTLSSVIVEPTPNATIPTGRPSTMMTLIATGSPIAKPVAVSSSPAAAPIKASSSKPAAAKPTSNGANGVKCSLDAAFKAHGKKYLGNIADSNLLSNTVNAQILNDNFGQLTPENSMKWDATEATQGKFTLDNANVLVDWATKNGKLIRGHTTVWHSQLPTWVSSITDKTKLEEVMVAHIKKLIGTYAGKVYAWDVVNEIFTEEGGFRSSVFYNVLGENFVKIAFTAARAADPAAKLYINDYNLDSPAYAKTKGFAANVKKWVAAGVPIDGTGSQSHLGGSWPIKDVPAALKMICADVKECAMTELDIKGASPTDFTTAVGACLDEKKCVGVTIWGVSDKDSWRKGENPLLFDQGYKAKEAYNALCTLLA